METKDYFTEKADIKTITNEEYFLVDFKDTTILTKIQYTGEGGQSFSFVDGRWIHNFVGISIIEKRGENITKDIFEKELNNQENNTKLIYDIKNELNYMVSIEKTEKRFFDVLDKRTNLDREKIISALDMAKDIHKNQRRDEGSPYIIHPMSVAIYAMRDGLDTESIIVCLLHDAIEDTEEDIQIVQKKIIDSFGEKVLYMIECLSKKIGDEKKSMEEYYGEIIADQEVSKIKGFDRLHNVYSLFLQPDQKKVSKYIDKTEQEILPLIASTETFYNIQNILKILKNNTGDFEIYKERVNNIKKIEEKKTEL